MGFFDKLFAKRPQNVVVLEPKKPEKQAARQTIIESRAEPLAPLPLVYNESYLTH
jgi:hypothetical protein